MLLSTWTLVLQPPHACEMCDEPCPVIIIQYEAHTYGTRVQPYVIHKVVIKSCLLSGVKHEVCDSYCLAYSMLANAVVLYVVRVQQLVALLFLLCFNLILENSTHTHTAATVFNPAPIPFCCCLLDHLA